MLTVDGGADTGPVVCATIRYSTTVYAAVLPPSLNIRLTSSFPVLSLAGIICEHYGVLCESGPWSFKTAHAYLTIIDFFSITYALFFPWLTVPDTEI